MMGRRATGQGQLFYAFALDEVVPASHLVRKIDAVLDLSWVHQELAPFYSSTGRPLIDPELMLRMLILGYIFAIRSERQAEACHIRAVRRLSLRPGPPLSSSSMNTTPAFSSAR